MHYFPKVAILARNREHLRYIPGAAARTMVDHGIANPGATSGRVREIVLVTAAANYAERIGPASEAHLGGVKFTRWRRLEDSAVRVIEHHPRCLWL